MAAKRYYASNASDMRRTEEMQDSSMIRENHAAIANLPQEVMIKPWPVGGSYLTEPLDDTISGINRQRDQDAPVRKSGYKPSKLN